MPKSTNKKRGRFGARRALPTARAIDPVAGVDRHRSVGDPAADPAASTPKSRRPRAGWLSAFAYVGLGTIITVLLLALKVGIESSPIGPSIERYTYMLLTSSLPKFRPDGPGVVIVDISEFPGGQHESRTGKLVPTPRAELLEVIEVLAQLRPRAIGVDIDFSPTPDGWVDDGDPEFLGRVAQLNKSTLPIALGVFRTLREPEYARLGLPEYSALAAGLWLPRTGLERTPAWTKTAEGGTRLPSLGAALALRQFGDSGTHAQGWRQRFRERLQQSSLRPDSLLVGEVLTDYSAAPQMDREAIRITSAQELLRHRGRIEGRIVLVGVVDQALDRFPIPGQDHNVAGVVVHAAVANTLANEPIWEFGHNVRIALDLVLSVVLLLGVVALRSGWSTRGNLTVEHAESKALRWLIALTLVGGIVALVAFRVLWLDFLLVALTLWLHPRVGRLLHRIARRVRSRSSHVSVGT